MAEIFISYQWDMQREMIDLRERLQDIRYTCWMDVRNMGGGDPLFGTIREGMIDCKVVIACVTSNYTRSKNCRMELDLALELGKRIIPLKLDGITWPPQGPGWDQDGELRGPDIILPHFTASGGDQLLYIDFTKAENRWTGPKFENLLGQLKVYLQNPWRDEEREGGPRGGVRSGVVVGPPVGAASASGPQRPPAIWPKIEKSWAKLIADQESEPVLDYLREVFTAEQCNRVEAKKNVSPQAQNRELLDILRRKSPADHAKYLDALRASKQGLLADLIENTQLP